MARKSKYDELVNQTFKVEYNNETFEIDVLGTEMVEKVSKKTGRKYKVRRLWVGLTGSATELEIGTQSWNKKSFMKRLLKESEVEEVKQSTIRIVDGVAYGDVEDLVELGMKSGMYKYYRTKYSYKSYKERLDNLYDLHMSGDSNGAVEKMKELSAEVKRFKGIYEAINMCEAKGTLRLIDLNLEQYCRGLFYEVYGEKLIQLIDSYKSKVMLEWWKGIGNSGFGSSLAFCKFGFNKCKDEREVKRLYRKLSKELHPDLGGDQAKFIEMKKEYDKTLERLSA
ncbi:hypothetical protein [Turicibacter sp. TJ11]|uniref:hypothetical protein n=1 Tax=Turicibacter sp. TJ11 TaxID=2806443 RepID=UPI001F2805E5|nr:hypothetical protein [Turicibacter sp. TJ11]